MKSMLRGKPSGSQPLEGSFDSATGKALVLLFRRNCSCPHGVRRGTSLSFGTTNPAQKPVRSRRGAGPPVSVPNLLYKLLEVRFAGGESCVVCADACDEKSSASVKPTAQLFGRFSIAAFLTAPSTRLPPVGYRAVSCRRRERSYSGGRPCCRIWLDISSR